MQNEKFDFPMELKKLFSITATPNEAEENWDFTDSLTVLLLSWILIPSTLFIGLGVKQDIELVLLSSLRKEQTFTRIYTNPKHCKFSIMIHKYNNNYLTFSTCWKTPSRGNLLTVGAISFSLRASISPLRLSLIFLSNKSRSWVYPLYWR